MAAGAALRATGRRGGGIGCPQDAGEIGKIEIKGGWREQAPRFTLPPIINKGISMSKKVIVSIFILIFLLAGCASGSPDAQEPVIDSGTEDVLTATPQPSPTLPPPTSTGTATALPTAVPTATITPIPWPAAPITLENAGDVQEVSRWGRGAVERIQYLETNEAIIFTALGLYLYQVEPVALLAQIDEVNDFVVSDDEKWLAASKVDGRVEVWSLETKTSTQSIERILPESVLARIEKGELINRHVIGMAFSPDSSEIAIGYLDGLVDLWRLGEEAAYATLQNDYLALGPDDFAMWFLMKYSPDGKSLVVSRLPIFTTFSRLTFWSIPDGTLISVSQPARFLQLPSVNYRPDSSEIIVVESDQSFQILSLWDAQTGANVTKINTGLAVIEPGSLELLSNGEQLRLQGWDALQNYYQQVWQLPDGRKVESLRIQEIPPDEKRLAFEKELFLLGHYKTLWEVGDGWGHSRIEALDNQSFRITLQNDWLTFPEANLESFNLPSGEISPLYYDLHDQSLAWCTQNLLHWMDRDGNVQEIELPNLPGPCQNIVVSPTKRFVVGWARDIAGIINMETGKSTRFESIVWPILDVAFQDDEQHMVAHTDVALFFLRMDPEIVRVNPQSHSRQIGTYSNITFVNNGNAFLAIDGQNIFSSRDIQTQNRLAVWDTYQFKEIGGVVAPRVGASNTRVRFSTFALSPDETILATGDDSGYVRLWDFRHARELAAIEFGRTPVSLTFTPDGSGLLAVLADGTIRLLGVP
jgi:WD40 repeat protein